MVDDSDDSEDDLTDEDSEDEGKAESDSPRKKISPEARFARRFTQYYDLIGCHFPVLLRLRELAKLNVISTILRSFYDRLEEEKSKLPQFCAAVRKMLNGLRRRITFPICTPSKVSVAFNRSVFVFNCFCGFTLAFRSMNGTGKLCVPMVSIMRIESNGRKEIE